MVANVSFSMIYLPLTLGIQILCHPLGSSSGDNHCIYHLQERVCARPSLLARPSYIAPARSWVFLWLCFIACLIIELLIWLCFALKRCEPMHILSISLTSCAQMCRCVWSFMHVARRLLSACIECWMYHTRPYMHSLALRTVYCTSLFEACTHSLALIFFRLPHSAAAALPFHAFMCVFSHDCLRAPSTLFH